MSSPSIDTIVLQGYKGQVVDYKDWLVNYIRSKVDSMRDWCAMEAVIQKLCMAKLDIPGAIKVSSDAFDARDLPGVFVAEGQSVQRALLGDMEEHEELEDDEVIQGEDGEETLPAGAWREKETVLWDGFMAVDVVAPNPSMRDAIVLVMKVLLQGARFRKEMTDAGMLNPSVDSKGSYAVEQETSSAPNLMYGHSWHVRFTYSVDDTLVYKRITAVEFSPVETAFADP